MKVSASFIFLLLVNHVIKMTQMFPLKIIGISIFLKTEVMKFSEKLYTVITVNSMVFEINLFD